MAALGLTGGGLCWECQHRGRPPAGPVSHEYTILREIERNVISAGSAGSASSDNNITQTTNTEILNTIDMMTHGELTALTAQLFTEL